MTWKCATKRATSGSSFWGLHFEEAGANSELEAEKVPKTEKNEAAYWYTENGNITDLNRNDENGVKTELDYSYNTANNQIEDVAWSQPNIQFPPLAETHTMNYDANGNIVNEAFVGPMPPNPISMGSPQGSFTYDDYDELPTSISTASGTRNYRYDSNGQRIVKEVDANDKNYYLDGVIIDQNNEVVSYQTPEGYVSVSNNGGIIADYFYNVTDWLGTNRVVIDANGNVVNASDHYPFGKRMPDRIMVTDAEGNRYQFTGHEFDEETGFDYHGARYYNSELGRYMNVDRFAENFYGQSPYVYAGDMPVNAIDVNGDSLRIYYEGVNEETGETETKFVNIFDLSDEALSNVVELSGDNEFVKQVVESIQYLKDSDKKSIMEKLASRRKTVNIYDSNESMYQHKNYFGEKVSRLDYNTNGAMKIMSKDGEETGTYQSPAMGLYHEFVHAFRFQYRPIRTAIAREFGFDEQTVTRRHETPVARLLGEPVRKRYIQGGRDITVPNVTNHRLVK